MIGRRPPGSSSRRRTGEPRITDDEGRLLRRAARQVALQTAVAVAVVVVLVAAVVLILGARQRLTEADRTVRETWARADDVDDPPAGVFLVRVTASGEREMTEGAPSSVRAIDPRVYPTGLVSRRRGNDRLRIYTGNLKIGRVSAVTILDPRDRDRLWLLLGLAAILGVLGATAVATMIGRRAVRPLGQAMALQQRFVTDASHELRTPLTVLLTRIQLLRRHIPVESPATYVRDVDQLVADAMHLGAVINDLLLSAELRHRPQAGEDVDANVLAEQVAVSMQPLAQERSITLTAVMARTGPESPVVRGAPAALRRALTSLTDNALAHTAAGGHVTVQVNVAGADVTLTVIDDGEGIDPALAGRMVERFSRDTNQDHGRRFGLGLALVQEVANAHGGRLEMDGAPGVGSRFTLRMPRPSV